MASDMDNKGIEQESPAATWVDRRPRTEYGNDKRHLSGGGGGVTSSILQCQWSGPWVFTAAAAAAAAWHIVLYYYGCPWQQAVYN